jgi:hypothetical protein
LSAHIEEESGMKPSDGFDARRLRSPRPTGNWRWRLFGAMAALFAAFGILLAMAGAATLLGRPSVVGPLHETPGIAISLLIAGIVLLWGGINVWRRIRRRLRRQGTLQMSPDLLKKND